MTSLINSLAVMAVAACMAGGAHAAPAGNTEARADLASCAKPVYPADARAARHAGTVKLAFLVGADGKLADSKVDTSSGHPALDDAAHQALKLCKFSAASAKGKPVESWAHVAYVWKL
ncbi:energy transducer TonB [Massilia sp. CCM 8734]|uniref:energy transducer TonB n=1 Tax=Massilia sp. CCM 8734 TaxID=2609283 RepID=UPI00141FD5C6|nr:energy transducer TonB [Massilia sp. CCM 8734]NHZ97002.1 TonB family protein [Massilia sp. CCM 8734]